MKLYCFVILIFISVIFTVGEVREWGNGGGVYSLPASTTNQNKVISNSYSQSLLARRSLVPEDTVVDVDKKLNTTDTTDNSEDPKSPKHPPPIDNGDKAKHVDGSIQSQNPDEKQTAEKLEEEAQTIKKVIVVLCSLGASLLLVAIAIAILYWKVRRQQQDLNKNKSSLKGSSRGGDTSGNAGSTGNITNGDDNNSDGNVKNDSGSGVGGETSDSISLVTAPLILGEKINNPGVNNGVIVCDKVSNDWSNIQYTKMPTILEQLPPPVRPSAPPEDKFDTDLDNSINDSNIPFSTPPITAPPAYSQIAPPTAPPIHALPFIPIPDDPMELYNYQSIQQQNSHNLEVNSNNNGIISPVYSSDSLPPNNGALYAAGPTSQTDTSVDYTSNQQTSHSTIIHSSSTVDLNSSSNSRENNDDDRPTHQRHNSSTI